LHIHPADELDPRTQTPPELRACDLLPEEHFAVAVEFVPGGKKFC
jgi:hypothetical protein